MEVFIGPAMIVVPGVIALVWALSALSRARAPQRWTRITGQVAAHERDATGEVVDVIVYPLATGGTHEVRPHPKGRYVSERPIGTVVPVWRDPEDGWRAVVEVPSMDRYAGALLAAILGAFAVVGGLVWSALIVVLVNR